MAKYETTMKTDFDRLLEYCNHAILSGSMSASLEDGSDFTVDEVRVAVRVYERFSMVGNNRLSLNLTLVGTKGEVALSAITSGGSEAMFFKINTIGEGSFLNNFVRALRDY